MSRYGRITAARRRALEAMASTFPRSARRDLRTELTGGYAHVSLNHAKWLIENGLAVENPPGSLYLDFTLNGIRLAGELGFDIVDLPRVCREWDCERDPVRGSAFCRAHGGRP